jgi:hypothetical protein
MAKPRCSYLYYGVSLLTAPQAAAMANNFSLVLLSSNLNTTANIASLKAANPACKVIVYINVIDGSANATSAPDNYLTQIALEGWLLKQNPASGANSPLMSSYLPAVAQAFSVNLAKIGPNSGVRPGVWYANNVVANIVHSSADGYMLDVASPYQIQQFRSVVDAANSGTSTAATASLITDTGKAWTVNANQHKLFRMTSGAAAGKVGWVLSNTATTFTPRFAISPAPSAGDTYEMYTYSAALNAYGGVNTDYLEDGTGHNLDSQSWADAIASASGEMMTAILAVRPTAVLMCNEGSGFDNKYMRNLPRDRVWTHSEGIFGAAYELGWRPALSLTRNNVRRWNSNASIGVQLASNTDYPLGRYALSASMMAGGTMMASFGYSNITPFVLDEMQIDFGEPIEPSPALPNADGTYSQRWSAGHIVANPTAGTVNVAVPSGFRRIQATSYGSQDTSLNNGSTTTVSLASKRAVMFVPA